LNFFILAYQRLCLIHYRVPTYQAAELSDQFKIVFKPVELSTPEFAERNGIMSASVDGPHLLRDVWAFAGVSIVVMFLRILARARIKKFSWDDMLMAFALVSLFACLPSLPLCLR
jgi:hypothetical protein